MAPTYTTTAHGLRWLPGGNLISDIDAGFQSLAEDVDLQLGAAAGGAVQEGVLDAGSFEVTQASGGASLTLDIASHVGSGCYVQDDSTARRALYFVSPTGAKSTVTVSAPHATLPRVDSVYVTLAGVVTYVAGTATSGATLDNARDGSHGGPTIPASALHLADLLVPATDTTIDNTQIRDRRKWARGAYATAALSGTGGVAITSTTFVTIASSLLLRVECSGLPLRVSLRSQLTYGGTGAMDSYFRLMVDAAALNGVNTNGHYHQSISDVNTVGNGYVNIACDFTPSAGSHTFEWHTRVSSSDTLTFFNDPTTGYPATIIIEEIVRQNTKNNATTSG